MARIKKELKEMFDNCKSLGEIFKAMGEAKKAGYTDEEVNTAASYRKNSFAKENNTNYKPISVTEYNLMPTNKYMTTEILVENLPSNVITYRGTVFAI